MECEKEIDRRVLSHQPLFLWGSGFGLPEAVSEIGSSGELVG